MKTLRLTVLALFAVSTLIAGCSPECVDIYDCAAKAKAANADFTCVSGVCKAGSPFPSDGGQ